MDNMRTVKSFVRPSDKSEEFRSGSGGFSLEMRLLAFRFEPMVDLALRRVQIRRVVGVVVPW
jgi:hypothetical protein